jgi:hypothetical protein
MASAKLFGITASAGIAAALAFGAPAKAINASVLYLAIDNSGSISNPEYNLQVQGWIDAIQALQDDPGYLNAVNPAYVGVSWWGSNDEIFEIPFQRLSDDASIDAFQDTLQTYLTGPPPPGRPGGTEDGLTNITAAIAAGRDRIANDLNLIDGDVIVRKTIDISFDGFQNTNGCSSNDAVCAPLQAQRDLALADGIVINALSVPLGGTPNDAQLIAYAEANFITLTGAPIAGQGFEGGGSAATFEAAAITKLRSELVPSPAPAAGLFTLLPLYTLRKRYRNLGRDNARSAAGDGEPMPPVAGVFSRS